MDLLQTRSLLEQGVGTQIAFLPERCAKLAIAETLSAMANTKGGVVLLGVTKAGAVRGVRDPAAQSEKALSAALLAQPPLILPQPIEIDLNGHQMVAVQVPPGLPHVYALDDRYLARRGAQNHCLKMHQVHELMERRGLMRFESQTADDASPHDLDTPQARRYAAQWGQSNDLNQVLQNRGCLTQTTAGLAPTFAGLLVFAQDPSRWIANAQITAVHYPGKEIDRKSVV